MRTPTIEEVLIKPVRIQIPTGNLKRGKQPADEMIAVWIRVPTDIEKSMCQSAARIASRRLRKLLEDKKSEEHLFLIREQLESAGDEDLRALYVQQSLLPRALRVQRESLEAREYIEEPEGDEVTPRDLDKYEDAVDEAEERREQSVEQSVKSIRDQLVREAEAMDHETLLAKCAPALIERLCSEAWTDEYYNQLLARCTFSDKACIKPAFKTASDAGALLPRAKETLRESHAALNIDPVALGNLAGGRSS